MAPHPGIARMAASFGAAQRITSAAIWLCLCLASPAAAVILDMPATATVIGGREESPSTMRLPIGPFAAGQLPLRSADGAISQRAYRMDDLRMTTLQMLTPLLAQLETAGYKTLFACDTSACGGFDFRYGMEVLPEPQMHVDLGDFRYVVAERPNPGDANPSAPDLVALLISRSADAGFVQVTTVSPPGAIVPSPPKPEVVAAPVEAPLPPQATLARPCCPPEP